MTDEQKERKKLKIDWVFDGSQGGSREVKSGSKTVKTGEKRRGNSGSEDVKERKVAKVSIIM